MYWEKYSETSVKKQELVSVFSKFVERESLTEILSDFYSVSQKGFQTGH